MFYIKVPKAKRFLEMYNERLLDYEDLERFLLRFENPKNIEAYRLENPKYVYWQETGEVKSD